MVTMPIQGISLKAQLELQRQVYRKAAKILTLSPSTSTGEIPSPEEPLSDSRATSAQPSSDAEEDGARHVAMLSNMGCVQHAQHKHHTAALCFSQALHKCAHLPAQNQVPLTTQSFGQAVKQTSNDLNLHLFCHHI